MFMLKSLKFRDFLTLAIFLTAMFSFGGQALAIDGHFGMTNQSNPDQQGSYSNSDLTGIYITPKAGVSIVQPHSFKETYKANGYTYTEHYTPSAMAAFTGGIAAGYDFMPQLEVPVRGEIEYMAKSRLKDDDSWSLINYKTKLNAQTLFANFYLDWHNDTPITPYIGGGVGMAFLRTEHSVDIDYTDISDTHKKTHTNFAWNVGVGTAYQVHENVALDLNYRYTALGKIDMKTKDEFDGIQLSERQKGNIGSHDIVMGVRFGF